jgi:2',3'-cyclic-nucleotide 2'-phosphodiesterase (5'-nucleotidase family)
MHSCKRPFTARVKIYLIAFIVLAIGLTSSADVFAATLAGWDVHGLPGGTNNFGPSPMAVTVSDPNLTVGGMRRASGVSTTGTGAARAWGGLAWTSANAAAAVTENKYASFTVSANSGYQVSFSSVSAFSYRRSGTGPACGVLQYQVGAGAFTDITTLNYSSSSSSGSSLAAIDLSAIADLQNVPANTIVTFRIVNNGGGSAGTWYIYDTANSTANDFEIQGTVAQGAQVSYTLTTATAGNGSGTISGFVNPYAPNSNATITANPNVRSTFTGWSGCSTSTEAIITVVMDGNKSCTANFTATSAALTIFHVNDTHARVTPHKMIVPGHGLTPGQFEDVGGAAYLAGKLLQLTANEPNSLVIDAGDISEGNPIGDMNGNGSMTQFYTLLSAKLQAQRGRGMDAVVVGNHDVRDVNYIANLNILKNSGVPVLSVNVRDINTHQPYFAPYNIVTINGIKIGVIGYTTQSAEVGASLSNAIEVVACDWSGTAAPCHLADYVNELRTTQGVDLVVLAAHIGQSGLVDPAAPLLVDTGTPRLPEVVVTGHWHTWAETPAWQPEALNYKTIFTEAGSYMKYVGELKVTVKGGYFSAVNYPVRDAEITPDPDVQTFISSMIDQYNAAHPGQPVSEIIGYTADDLMLDNAMRWWSANEYPWSGNNTAGQWICDAMQWKAEQLFGQCDLAMESGGGVRADIPAGPVTYLQIYETFPWNDDTFYRVNMTGQEIVNFLKQTNMDAGFSRALDVTAYDGTPTSVLFNGAPIDLNYTYTVAINNYMFNHPPTGWTWSDTNPLTSGVLCRDGIVDYMRQFTASNPYHVGGQRYHLNTEFSGGYRAVVTMMNDSDTKPTFEDAFIRLLSATPETLVRRGSKQVPSDLVNADSTINAENRLSEQELYRSFLGFKAGALRPGDIIEIWGKESFYGGNPEFVDQEGIYGDGIEFRIVGHDDSLAKPVSMSSIGAFWNDTYKNHYVQFIARKTGASTVADQYGMSITIMDATAYASKALPGNVGDTLMLTGVPTMESYGLRFRCDSAAVTTAALPAVSSVSSHVDPVPAGTTGSPVILSATAGVGSGIWMLAPVADAQVASGYPSTNYGSGTNLYVQSASSGYGNERGWLKFDLSAVPPDAAISSATLRLWNWKAAGASMPAAAHGGNDDTWTETGITWSTQPSFGPLLATQTLVTGMTSLWYDWDVTSFVQGKWIGNKLVSLVVKPVNEDSTDATPPSYAFDAKEYGSNAPVLQVTTQTGSVSISQVQFFYRYSPDNTTWGPWTVYGIADTAAPYSVAFNYPQGYGYYEFYSLATDGNNNVEQAPAAAQAFVHYAAAPAYSTEAIVALGNLSQTFDGAPKPASVKTIPPALSMNVTYNGAATTPLNAGTYVVSVAVTQPGYTGSARGMLFIAGAAAVVTLGDLSQTYDGSPKSVTITTSPAGLPVTITYNGSTTAPTSAGTYGVVATVNDPNYQGSAVGMMTITGAGAESVPGLGLWGFLGAAIGLGGFIARRRRS